MAYILSWSSGVVAVENRKHAGTIVLATGPRKQLELALNVCARHAYDGRSLLVPGIPEAETDEEKFSALRAFQRMLEKRLLVRSQKMRVGS